MSDELKRGLEGVLVAESDLSYVDGEVGKLVYRGYDIEGPRSRCELRGGAVPPVARLAADA